ncbi:uncharacterized protein LOC130547623 isoform X2 [Triplophysa rosa]|uniref:uncharacterized protein LOC130547623 isoform X2 n=1 Tax=Triplophysa rosa TaxID=992332 RepID=UPI002545BFA9|nr:uncharacterized protein LOC130547623 isoform X2 [Triplophysa rosa]
MGVIGSIALRLLPGRSWKVIKTKNMLTQGEGPDCGLFMLMYALYMALAWTVDFSQEDIPQLRRWWCHLILDNMSPASVSESTTTKESPPRHPVVCQQEDNDEVCEKNVKCRFVQDIGPAWSWVQTHRAFFRGEVMEPAYLQMDYENQQRLLEEYLRGDLEARDAFLFEFECAEDLDTFISNYEETIAHQSELEAVEKQIQDLLEKQTRLRERKNGAGNIQS